MPLNLDLDAFCPLKHKPSITLFVGRKHPIHALMILPDGWPFPTIFNGWLILKSIFTGSLPAGQGLLKAYESQGRRELISIKALKPRCRNITHKTPTYRDYTTRILFSWQWILKGKGYNGYVYCFSREFQFPVGFSFGPAEWQVHFLSTHRWHR